LNPQDNVSTLEAAAGVPLYGLDLSQDDYATEGTLAWQIITLAAGDTLRFNYSFSTQEGTLPPSQKDHAFVVLGGQVFTLATAVNPPVGTYGFVYQAPTAATLRLAFGVVDTTDFIGATSLSISNVSVAPIPEPTSAALLLAGLGLLLGATKLKR
jgi:PEP-CTERM motif